MAETIPPSPSAFLAPPPTVTYSPTPSIIHLKRDLLLPVSFTPPTEPPTTHHDGRSRASNSNGILNTRFGDFPHSSIIGIPYGSQVRATNLGHNNRKRKRKDAPEEGGEEHGSSGFLHVLAPTAESWTSSLPHRTQVVYTPDSSYILHKLGVRPGSVLIEAGAGSGSFTHAGVRAVYRGYPDGREGAGGEGDKGDWGERKGKVWSFEFHKERVGKLREEIEAHGLGGLVEVVHRDVCKEGFLIRRKKGDGGREVNKGEAEVKEEIDEEEGEEGDWVSPGATVIFLDLPAPWLALPHLTRRTCPTPSLPTSTRLTPSPSPAPADAIASGPAAIVTAATPLAHYLDPNSTSTAKPSISSTQGTTTLDPSTTDAPTPTPAAIEDGNLPSALSPTETVRICTFSPCIEQVTRTVSVLRKLGWAEIEMLEIQHRRIEVRKNNRKGYEDGAGPRSVAEAVQRLKWVGDYRNNKKEKDALQAALDAGGKSGADDEGGEESVWKTQSGRERKPVAEGRLVTRVEPEVKSHTSYLVFAVLPREWTAEDEEGAVAYVKATTKGTVNAPIVGDGEKWKWKGDKVPRVSKRQLKRLEKEQRKVAEEAEKGVKKKGEGEGGGEVKEGDEEEEGGEEETEEEREEGEEEGEKESNVKIEESGDKMEVGV